MAPQGRYGLQHRVQGEQNKPNRINCYTPRIRGVQIGITYAPKVQPKIQPGGIWGLTPGPGTDVGGICGFSNAVAGNDCPVPDNSWQDAVAVGVNYLNKLGELSIAVHGAFSTMTFNSGLGPVATAYNTINGANLASWKQAVIGLQFNIYGFTLAAHGAGTTLAWPEWLHRCR